MQLLWKIGGIEKNLDEEEAIIYIRYLCKTAYSNTLKLPLNWNFQNFDHNNL